MIIFQTNIIAFMALTIFSVIHFGSCKPIVTQRLSHSLISMRKICGFALDLCWFIKSFSRTDWKNNELNVNILWFELSPSLHEKL